MFSNKKRLIAGGLCFLITLLVPYSVFAADVAVKFGTESYSVTDGEQFNIGLYIEAEQNIGAYYIEVEYDKKRLKYISGAEDETDGILILEGTGFDKNIKYWFTFEAIGGGDAGIVVKTAQVYSAESNGGNYLEIEDYMFSPIKVSGTNQSGESFENNLLQNQQNVAALEGKYPILGDFRVDGTELYAIDHTRYIPSDVNWEYKLSGGKYQGIDITYLIGQESKVGVLYFLSSDEVFSPYMVNLINGNTYQVNFVKDKKGNLYMYAPGTIAMGIECDIDNETIESQNLAYVIDCNGNGFFANITKDGDIIRWEDSQASMSGKNSTRVGKKWWIVLLGFLIGGMFVFYLKKLIIKNQKDRKDIQNKHLLDRVEVFEFAEGINESKEEPVISVKNVSMKFKTSTSDASGLKEFMIQKIKKQVTYREFYALDHVSFDVFKGEVVGIIGTNGSGKSTMLRIVSGALNPSGGRVEVDRSKVQLLTLGTGFDMELTARENIYLNGAIIGYSKKFIDEHFDEIIEFAELNDFVDEKVKNFSSGMVSRLGFAIATVGDAAEILILDEVLSVGDEFFRKKSLARVKEMIHGGSTVLMVSHGMDTIMENCTKVVWIEKGILKMVGDAKSVCKKIS